MFPQPHFPYSLHQRMSNLLIRFVVLLLIIVSMLLFNALQVPNNRLEAMGMSAETAQTTYTGIPTFSIVRVSPGETVTIRTSNFPANQTFTVRMGAMYTRGIGGEVITTFNSGAGGVMEMTFDIPDTFAQADRIAIRAETAHTNPYFSYNWFNNVTSTTPPDDDDDDDDTPTTPAPTPAPTTYTGYPTFTVCTVSRDSQITIAARNLPPNQTFIATMGDFGTRGVGGIQVATVDSGSGGTANITLNIPADLHGSYRIAVRLQTTHAVGPYHAYNWFYNNNASVCGG